MLLLLLFRRLLKRAAYRNRFAMLVSTWLLA